MTGKILAGVLFPKSIIFVRSEAGADIPWMPDRGPRRSQSNPRVRQQYPITRSHVGSDWSIPSAANRISRASSYATVELMG